MSNATTHAGPGAINISLDVADDHFTLTVNDAGPGMTPDQAATSVEPFVSHGTNPGVGIGLTIADRLAAGRRWQPRPAKRSRRHHGHDDASPPLTIDLDLNLPRDCRTPCRPAIAGTMMPDF